MSEQRGVSPVVGVVLLIAIVTVLVGVVGVYLLGFTGQTPAQAPQVAVVAEYSDRTTGNGQYLNLSFESGERLDRQNVSLVVTGAADGSGSDVSMTTDPVETQTDTTIAAGTEVSLNASHFTGASTLDLSEATVRLVWNPADDPESETSVVYRWPEPGRRN